MAAALPILESSSPGYECPIDSQMITRSVHLARLATGQVGCSTCEYRNETGSLPRQIASRAHALGHYSQQSLITSEGLRGLYLNQFTRERVAHVIQHVLDLVHQSAIRDADTGGSPHDSIRIVTGYDSRPSSPDLAIGGVASMKRWGCDIVDVGLLSRPAFELAVAMFRPHVGIYFTGGDRPHQWNGLDIIERDGLPWCAPGKLNEIEKRLDRPPARFARTQGRYETISIQDEYQTALAMQFHAIRPLRLAIACSNPIVRETLSRLLDDTPCSVHFVGGTSLSVDGTERSQKLLVNTLCERRLDAGFLIGQDGRACQLFDEGGHDLAVEESLALLQQGHLETNEFSKDSPERTPLKIDAASLLCDTVTEVCDTATEAELLKYHRQEKTPIIADRFHRFWFPHDSPPCDAIQTLARVLEVLSLSDRPLSDYRQNRHRSK